MKRALSMLILYDFVCPDCGKKEEALVERGVESIPCHCGAETKRVVSPVRSMLEGITGGFPDAADKWAKRHETEGRKPSDTHPKGW